MRLCGVVPSHRAPPPGTLVVRGREKRGQKSISESKSVSSRFCMYRRRLCDSVRFRGVASAALSARFGSRTHEVKLGLVHA